VVDGDPVAIGDRSRLRQALGNLVDNALRHGAGAVTLHSAPLGDHVAIDVSDEGPGFARDVVRCAFERFARGDQARTRAGSGLGLAIVRALAEAHGGQATITGRATVRVTVPVAG
jgi:signal transduction histidine kinase